MNQDASQPPPTYHHPKGSKVAKESKKGFIPQGVCCDHSSKCDGTYGYSHIEEGNNFRGAKLHGTFHSA